MNIEEHIPAFINFYYTTILKNPKDLFKFYHPNATYYRSYLRNHTAIKVEPEKVCPRIAKKSVLTITDYSYSTLDKDVSLNITGNWTSKDRISVFAQFFILREVSGRICIMQDYFNEFRPNAFQQDQSSRGQMIEIHADSINQESNENSNKPNSNQQQNAENESADIPAEMYECERPEEPPQQTHKNRNKKKKWPKKNNFVYVPGKDD